MNTVNSMKDAESEEVYDDVSTVMKTAWDPLHCADWDKQLPNATCLARIKR